jgi:hypothetical protein
MPKCRVCNAIYNSGCLCSFCSKCIKQYGHEGCYKILEERKKNG